MNNKILHALLFTPSPEGWWGLPGLLWGPPGVGKTAFLKATAQRTNMAYERLSPAERGEGQFGVVPIPGADGFLHYPPPDWSQRFADRAGLIFIDEINTAVPALQAPLLGFVQLRTLGSYTFGPRTRVLAAANETADAAGGWDLAPALANRFGHFEFEGFDTSDWITGLLSGFAPEETTVTDAGAEEARVMSAWPKALAEARGIVAAFIKARPTLLYAKPKNASKQTSRAWPSNRSVEYATHAFAGARVHGLSEIDTDALMSGFVGQGWVGEFHSYREHLDLPDVEDVLDGKITFKHDQRRLDRTLAFLSGAAAFVVPAKVDRRNERVNVLWRLLGEVVKESADLVVPAAQTLVRARLMLAGGSKASDKTLAEVLPILRACGLVGG